MGILQPYVRYQRLYGQSEIKMSYLTMEDLDLSNKRVLIREDFNVPMQKGEILSDAKIRAALPTINLALEKGAQILLMSHLGRPKEGHFTPEYSLVPVAHRLSTLLNHPVHFEKDWLWGPKMELGEIVLGENVRFLPGEESNDATLAKQMASLCDVFIMDAFASAHRAHASTTGVAQFAKMAAAGPLLIKELQALDHIMQSPKRPLLAIVGGSKISSKLGVIEALINIVDKLIVGGGIANTFLAAQGVSVGTSLYEKDLIPKACDLLTRASLKHVEILLPIDARVADNAKATGAASRLIDLDMDKPSQIKETEMILDIGPKTQGLNHDAILSTKTLLWNGPVGLFEVEDFSQGTRALAASIAQSQAYSVAGGGETIAAIEQFGITDKISYISTGGGAFLEYIEGKPLPAIAALENKK